MWNEEMMIMMDDVVIGKTIRSLRTDLGKLFNIVLSQAITDPRNTDYRH